MTASAIEYFGGRLRTRVCGLFFVENKVLLAKHDMNGKDFYSPPGGGQKFGESLSEALVREFKEETFLNVFTHEFLFIHEFLQPPLHANEFFFKVEADYSDLRLGTDPELMNDAQILKGLYFFSIDEIQKIPDKNIHRIFRNIESFEDLFTYKSLLFKG